MKYTAIFVNGNLTCVIKKAQMQNLKLKPVKDMKRYIVENALSVDFEIKTPKKEKKVRK
jgi:hypothetical protein